MIFKKILGLAASAVGVVFAVTTVVLNVVGWSTAPEDAAALQGKLPNWVLWFMGMPWWAVVLVFLALLAYAALTFWPDYSLAKQVAKLQGQVSSLSGDVALVLQITKDQKSATDNGLIQMESKAQEHANALNDLIPTLWDTYKIDYIADFRTQMHEELRQVGLKSAAQQKELEDQSQALDSLQGKVATTNHLLKSLEERLSE